MRGRNDIFYWQLLSTSTPFSSTEGLAKGTPFKDSGPCLPTSLSVVSDCRSPVPGVSEPGSPALRPVTAAAEPLRLLVISVIMMVWKTKTPYL